MGRLDSNRVSLDRRVMPVPLQALLGVWMGAVIAGAFLYLPPMRPEQGFATPHGPKIVVFHVPCAAVAVLAYVVSTAYAIAYLSRRRPECDAKSAISAGLGFLFTVLATVTGMVFARMEWGSAWNWDPRETSILMLLIAYAAYFALRGAIPAAAARARISASYNILAGLIMPYLVFVLPRLTQSLHPERARLEGAYRIVMFSAMAGFALLYVWLFRLHVRIAEAASARRRKQVA